jgi:DNA-binding transcriptional regulator WhiA
MQKININREWLIQQLEIKSVKEISQELNINPYTLRRKIKEHGILCYKTKGKKKVLPNKQKLEEELKKYSIKELAKKYKISITSFRKHVKEIGIIRSRHAHLINEDFFKKITKESAYILGFIFADGSINTSLHHNQLNIELNKKDIEVLEFIRSNIQSSIKIYKYKRKHKKTKKYYFSVKVCFSSKEIVKDLIKLGCCPNKTHKEIKVPCIPKEFYKDFIRGVFDGDGSVYITKNKDKTGCYICCSSISFLKDIQNILGFGNIDEKANPPRLSFYSKKDKISFFNYIYSHGFYLKRKFNKFKEVLSK